MKRMWTEKNSYFTATRIANRRAVLDGVARSSGEWGNEWHRDESDWAVFGAYRRLVELGPHSEGTAWLTASLVQLRDAGLLDLLAAR